MKAELQTQEAAVSEDVEEGQSGSQDGEAEPPPDTESAAETTLEDPVG